MCLYVINAHLASYASDFLTFEYSEAFWNLICFWLWFPYRYGSIALSSAPHGSTSLAMFWKWCRSCAITYQCWLCSRRVFPVTELLETPWDSVRAHLLILKTLPPWLKERFSGELCAILTSSWHHVHHHRVYCNCHASAAMQNMVHVLQILS